MIQMQTARYINVALWFYLLASDVLNPVTTAGDFWTEKANQALRLNHNLEHPAAALGNAFAILILWFATDSVLSWLQRRAAAQRLEAQERADASSAWRRQQSDDQSSRR
jgi:hypothetical protein